MSEISKADRHTAHKQRILPLRQAMYDFSETGVRSWLETLFLPETKVRLSHPMGEMQGPAEFYDKVYQPLFRSLPDLERRDTIVMAGPTSEGLDGSDVGGITRGPLKSPGSIFLQQAIRFRCDSMNSISLRKTVWSNFRPCGTSQR